MDALSRPPMGEDSKAVCNVQLLIEWHICTYLNDTSVIFVLKFILINVKNAFPVEN